VEGDGPAIGYWLVAVAGAGARGRGLAAHALRAVVSFAFGELAVRRLALRVAVERRVSPDGRGGRLQPRGDPS
jgi:RimJ/RimL family protein N-acetyltransferase